MKKKPSIEAFVLAGGKSSRMGQDKGLMSLNGRPMLSYVLEALKENDLKLSVIANTSGYHSFGVPVYPDLVPEKGPMGGLHTAFEHSRADSVLLLSCDMPLLSANAVERLLKEAVPEKIIVPSENGKLHPLFALYPKAFSDNLLERIQRGDLKMKDYILNNPHSLVSSITQEFPGCFKNINTPEEFKEVENQCRNLP